MSASHQNRAEEEIERLRRALEAETSRCLEMQRQLDRAGEEFEEFVSKAAHNLRESLRDVAAFSQLLAESRAGRFEPEEDMFLERIREGAARMQSLLAGMVGYSSAASGLRQAARTEMEATLLQALLCAEKQIAERNALVTHDPLPAVMGDFESLTKLLHHLIRNALEYSGAIAPRVHVSSRRVDSVWVFSVQYNGPGIEPAFQSLIFDVFKRLDGKEHPGNGLGLAFCKKVVEWHGGRMWLESVPGNGSTFYFSLLPAD